MHLASSFWNIGSWDCLTFTISKTNKKHTQSMFNGKKWIKDVLLSKHPKNSLQEVNYGKKNMLGTVAVFLFYRWKSRCSEGFDPKVSQLENPGPRHRSWAVWVQCPYLSRHTQPPSCFRDSLKCLALRRHLWCGWHEWMDKHLPGMGLIS